MLSFVVLLWLCIFKVGISGHNLVVFESILRCPLPILPQQFSDAYKAIHLSHVTKTLVAWTLSSWWVSLTLPVPILWTLLLLLSQGDLRLWPGSVSPPTLFDMSVDPCFMWNSQRLSKTVVQKYAVYAVHRGAAQRGMPFWATEQKRQREKEKQCIKMRTAMYNLTLFIFFSLSFMRSFNISRCSLRGH